VAGVAVGVGVIVGVGVGVFVDVVVGMLVGAGLFCACARVCVGLRARRGLVIVCACV
jgi:hypothetical protein